jgi:hypothetical protein
MLCTRDCLPPGAQPGTGQRLSVQIAVMGEPESLQHRGYAMNITDIITTVGGESASVRSERSSYDKASSQRLN